MANRDNRSWQSRARIADLAARYMAEHGIRDYGLAKRKAVRQLGLPDGHGMPSNEEVDAALIQRQDLYEPEEQAATLDALRQQALAVMGVFERFEPVLTGAVASGAVSENSLVELEINVDSSKEFEQQLHNAGIGFKIQDKGGRMAYLLYAEPADVLVRLVPFEPHRTHGAARARLTRAQLDRLMAARG
ncbi:MAG: hypothetical protein AB1899_11515 [Pseudomonadota bacterium]